MGQKGAINAERDKMTYGNSKFVVVVKVRSPLVLHKPQNCVGNRQLQCGAPLCPMIRVEIR
jgi:hypothetical protein